MLVAGSMPRTATPALHVRLQEIAVVAGGLHHQAGGAEPAIAGQAFSERSGARDRRIRVRGEIHVLAKEDFRGHGFGDLHERTALAKHEIEREGALRLGEL